MTFISTAQAETPLILALDIGTSSIRAMLFDTQARVVSGLETRQPNDIEVRLDGAFETDPDALLEKVWLCIDDVLNGAGTLAGEVRAVCCCTFVSNVMGIDADGQAVTALVLYGDTRAAQQADDLRARLDEEHFHQRTGTRFHSSYLPARFLWWQQERPDEFARVQRWISIGEYLLLKLFGNAAASYSVASWTGLLDRVRLDWDDELLQHLPIRRDRLPALVDADFAWRGLHKEFAARWPALTEAAWFPAIGDGAAANLGSGCATPARVAISMGTSSAVRTVITDSNKSLPPGLWCYRVDRQRSLLGGAMTEGGSVFTWLNSILNLDGIGSLETALAKLPPAATGLTFLPLISGERSPGWQSGARGVIVGLSIAHTPLDLLRAGLEGVACRIAQVYELLRPVLPVEPEIVASGGAIQGSPAWQQILADALNHPVRLSRVPETSTRGAVLLALEALGIVKDLKELPDLSVVVAEPEPRRHARYRQMIEQQKDIYRKLIADEV
ncbi:MAG: carbohydrate kinase [Chloroflexi bacterium]|nr:MAG: carbohydrate kinase [Chloroflexota bacterium]